MERRFVFTLVLAVCAAPAAAGKDPVRNAREATVDNRQIALDRAEWSRDATEVAEFESWVVDLADACRDRMAGRYQGVNARVRSAMEREIVQVGAKRGQAGRESRQSRREARDARMEAGATGSGVDQLQAIDVGHDRRDDRGDVRSAADRSREMKRVGGLSAALANDIARGNRSAMEKNLELAREFLSLMREDVGATTVELREDKVERREDRRERRTDRR